MRFLLLLLSVTACDVMYEPDVGTVTPDATSSDADLAIEPNVKCADSDPATPVTFSAHVRPLFARSPGACTGCHGASATSGFNMLTYDSIRSGGQISGTRSIVPGKPCESILLQKLGPAPPFGTRMPYSGPPFYSAADLAVVRDWIAEGALDN